MSGKPTSFFRLQVESGMCDLIVHYLLCVRPDSLSLSIQTRCCDCTLSFWGGGRTASPSFTKELSRTGWLHHRNAHAAHNTNSSIDLQSEGIYLLGRCRCRFRRRRDTRFKTRYKWKECTKPPFHLCGAFEKVRRAPALSVPSG